MSSKDPNEKFVSLSHDLSGQSFEECVKKREMEIHERGDLPEITVKAQVDLLKKAAQSALGRFMIQNRGLNGYWTDYVLLHAKRAKAQGLKMGALEDFFLNQAPTSLATQERLEIFQKVLQTEVKEGAVMASVPCGLMSELLMLDFTGIDEITLIGSDIDVESIELAKKRAQELKFPGKLYFNQADAWKLELPQKVDVLTSNGLNIYESDDEKVVELYKSFFAQIKPGGLLVTSFLTSPPNADSQSEWRLNQINIDHLMRQKELFVDVIGVAWQAYRSSEKTREQLSAAGFVEVEIIPDRANIFPTVVARKPSPRNLVVKKVAKSS